jgi:3-hydroxyisobutyrate dehydrogenase-like beta-hydroxyacid dehydrogenase
MTMKEIRNVGVVGLGKMGMPMARLIGARGFAVIGYDVALPAIKAAAAIGVRPVNSPKGVAAASDLVIVAVGFDSEVEAVMFGDDGVLAGAADGSLIAIASTVAPATMRRLERRCAGRNGIKLLDIPLCRGEQAAERGKLLVMGGGDKDAFDACRPVFAAFADSVFHLGALGSGQVGKMVNNLILWACISANDEGLKLGHKLGVEREALREALVASSASNWALASRIEEQPMPWAEKDMTIVLKEADHLRMSLPLCGVVKEVVKTVKFEHNWPTPHPPED